jgi:hypothetical protein
VSANVLFFTEQRSAQLGLPELHRSIVPLCRRSLRPPAEEFYGDILLLLRDGKGVFLK